MLRDGHAHHVAQLRVLIYVLRIIPVYPGKLRALYRGVGPLRKLKIKIAVRHRISRFAADNPGLITVAAEPELLVFLMHGGIVKRVVNKLYGRFRIPDVNGGHKHDFRHLKALLLILQQQIQKGINLRIVYAGVGRVERYKI